MYRRSTNESQMHTDAGNALNKIDVLMWLWFGNSNNFSSVSHSPSDVLLFRFSSLSTYQWWCEATHSAIDWWMFRLFLIRSVSSPFNYMCLCKHNCWNCSHDFSFDDEIFHYIEEMKNMQTHQSQSTECGGMCVQTSKQNQCEADTKCNWTQKLRSINWQQPTDGSDRKRKSQAEIRRERKRGRVKCKLVWNIVVIDHHWLN